MSDEVWRRIEADRVVELTRALVRRPSVNPPGDYREVTRYVEDELREIGLEVRVVEGEPGRRNIVGRLAGTGQGEGEALCLAAHTDVVGVGDLSNWEVDPFAAEVRDGVLWGRGAADSKGMLAGMMAAAEALARSGARPAGDLYVVAYVDDETAGPMGLRHVFDQGAVRARRLVLGEATDFAAQYVFKGRVWFTVETLGRSAHGAFPQRGVNAVERAFEVIRAVKGLDLGSHPELGDHSKNVGMMHGGRQVNVVPDSCVTAFDLRWGPPASSRDVLRRVRDALGRLREKGTRCNDPVVTEERDPLEFGTENPLLARLGDAVGSVRGHAMKLGGWYSSGELYPVFKGGHIDFGAVIGPGEPWQAHAFNERIPVADLVSAARVYADLAVRVCGPPG